MISSKLSELTDIKTGNKDLKDNVEDGEYPFFVRSSQIERINSYSYDGEAILIPGDGVGVGKIYHYINGKFDYHQRVYKISDFTNNILGKYIYYYLIEKFPKQVHMNSQKASVDSLRLPTIENMEIVFPNNIEEQKKIVNFLSIIDKKIELLEKTLSLYQKHTLKILDNIIYQKYKQKEWNVTILKDIGTSYNGLSGKNKDDFNKGNSSYITYTSVFNDIELNLSKIEKVNIDSQENQNKVQKGDIFFTTSSETPKEVGMASVLTKDIENCYLNSFCFGFRLDSFENYNPIFLTYYFRSTLFKKELYKLAQGSTRFNISKKELLKKEINIPGINEQDYYVKFIKNNFTKLYLIEKELKELKNFKKSLLQKMFI